MIRNHNRSLYYFLVRTLRLSYSPQNLVNIGTVESSIKNQEFITDLRPEWQSDQNDEKTNHNVLNKQQEFERKSKKASYQYLFPIPLMLVLSYEPIPFLRQILKMWVDLQIILEHFSGHRVRQVSQCQVNYKKSYYENTQHTSLLNLDLDLDSNYNLSLHQSSHNNSFDEQDFNFNQKPIKHQYNHSVIANIIAINRNNYIGMDTVDIFHPYETFDFIQKDKAAYTTRNSSLNPWSEEELSNPFLNVKNQFEQQNLKNRQFKRKQERKKVVSLDQAKLANYNLKSSSSRENSDLNKVSKQLPKLNIGQLIKNNLLNKKKGSLNSSQFSLNASPICFSSPTLKKTNQLHHSSQIYRKSKLLPSVARELNITRKIFLLQNKLKNANTPSPQRKLPRNDKCLRKLVQKQWEKKKI